MNLEREKYILVRRSQANGARTIEELRELSDVVLETEEEIEAAKAVLKIACKCKQTSVADVVAAVNAGADTLQKVMEATSAGTDCKRCKRVLQNIIDTRR